MKTLIFSLLFSFSAWTQDVKPSCVRFRVHLLTDLPEVLAEYDDRSLPLELTEKLFQWKNYIDFLMDQNQRESWIKCIKRYIYLDSDKDGIRDWTAIVDGRPSSTLFPLDEDMDGDGILNLLDEDPYRKNSSHSSMAIPFHLALKGEAGLWQKKLNDKFGVLAVGHTDKHHGDVLKAFYQVLSLHSINKLFLNKSVPRVIYAMLGRHPEGKIASYHPTADAIGVPGGTSYGKVLNPAQLCKLTSALIHEMGHSYLFRSVSPAELRKMANSYAKWELPEQDRPELWDKMFQTPYTGETSDFISEYSASNVHEWFAENFAAYIWRQSHLDKRLCPAFLDKKLSINLLKWFDSKLL